VSLLGANQIHSKNAQKWIFQTMPNFMENSQRKLKNIAAISWLYYPLFQDADM